MIKISNESPILSIVIATYNHRAYIARALDSVLNQVTDYSCEILIGDDCSTDGTQDIIHQYESLYPEYFNVYYRKTNMFKQKLGNMLDLILRTKGKYLIVLEGDDFWTDNSKIQKQIRFLELNQEYIAVAHLCTVVGADSKPLPEIYPQCRDSEYTFDHYKRFLLPGQTTTILMRNIYINNKIDTSLIFKRYSPGDRSIAFTLISNGKIFCIQEVMSAYRHVTTGGSSYSANFKPNFGKNQKLLQGLYEYAEKIDNSQAISCAKYLYIKGLVHGFIRRKVTFQQLLSCLSLIKRPFLFTLVEIAINDIIRFPLSIVDRVFTEK